MACQIHYYQHLKEGLKREAFIVWCRRNLLIKKAERGGEGTLSWTDILENCEGRTAMAWQVHYYKHLKEGEKRSLV